jgi:hypothetical protein
MNTTSRPKPANVAMAATARVPDPRACIMNLRTLQSLVVIPAFFIALPAPARAADFDQSHRLFDQVLKRHVKNGLVDYTALKAGRADLDTYLDQSAAVPESEFARWNQSQQIAFLANLYNAATLRLIIDHYPVKSIKDIGGVFSGPWKQKVVQLWGATTTLDDLEHGILRKKYAEPRIHFALVCAAISCSPLREEAYTGAALDSQLDDQGRKFLGDPQKNRVDAPNRVVYLSSIFHRYGGDFEKKAGSVLAFIQTYLPKDVQTELARGDFKIQYLDYNWSVNDFSARK